MGRLDGALGAWHAATVEVVTATAEVVRGGSCELLEGLPLDHWLRLRARMLGADVHTLVTAADVLPGMPATWELFRRGALSWGSARNVALRLARRSVADRAVVDRRLAATAGEEDQLDGWSADRLLEAVDVALDELDGAAAVERDEVAAEDASYVAVQTSFDGRVRGGFDLDPVRGATFLDGLDAATPDGPAADRAARRADGLTNLAAAWLGGGADRPAKPLVRVVLDLAAVTVTAAGRIQLATPGCLPVLSARLVDALAADADVQAVLVDGARPLTTTRKRTAADIPADVRAAVVARDVADRMPGSRRPLQHVHHLRHRDDGGGHHPDNLAGLSMASHRVIHRNGWTTTIDLDTGAFSITRDGRTWTAVPPARHLAR